MLKIIGGILIIASCTGAGFAHAMGIEARYKELWGLKQSVSRMKSDIQYSHICLREIFINIGKISGEEGKEFWDALINEISGKESKNFYLIWEKNVRKYMGNGYLNDNDLNEFIKLGETLGGTDRKQQISILELYLSRVEQSISLLDEEKNKRKKTAQSLGVVLGLFVVIILC